jgi:hypothetical protein
VCVIVRSRRGALITCLAFVYVPLSFVTGIFGMNVKEINGSHLSVWTCFVALGVVMIGNLLVFLAYKEFEGQSVRLREKLGRLLSRL